MRPQAGKASDLFASKSRKKTWQADPTDRLCGENRIDEYAHEECTNGLIAQESKRGAWSTIL